MTGHRASPSGSVLVPACSGPDGGFSTTVVHSSSTGRAISVEDRGRRLANSWTTGLSGCIAAPIVGRARRGRHGDTGPGAIPDRQRPRRWETARSSRVSGPPAIADDRDHIKGCRRRGVESDGSFGRFRAWRPARCLSCDARRAANAAQTRRDADPTRPGAPPSRPTSGTPKRPGPSPQRPGPYRLPAATSGRRRGPPGRRRAQWSSRAPPRSAA